MLLEENPADAAVVGRPVIVSPDLARRWQEDHPLNEIDQATVYTDGAAGYTDYPEPPAASLYPMDSAEPRRKARIKRVEAVGLGLLAVAALASWGASAVLGATYTDAAGRHVLLHFFGFSRDSICGLILLASLLGGVLGLLLLAGGLIGRIRKAWLRETVGWTSLAAALLMSPAVALMALLDILLATGISDQTRFEAEDGQSVVVTQDAFDGDFVGIYTEQGPFHYVWNRHAAELRGFPRVKDRTCNLAAADGLLRLTCGA